MIKKVQLLNIATIAPAEQPSKGFSQAEGVRKPEEEPRGDPTRLDVKAIAPGTKNRNQGAGNFPRIGC